MKVKTSPNSKFADISAICQAQLKAGDPNIEGDDKEEANESDSTLDCIIID
jgi:hypothetical protein